MPLPSGPPATTTPAVFEDFWQDTADTCADHETRIDDLEASATVDDTAYNATSWNGETSTAPSKNAVRDKIEDILDGVTFTGDVVVPDEAYGSGWNGSLEVPTKNAVYDKIETLGGGGGGSIVLVDVYRATSNQSISNATNTAVQFNAEVSDSGGYHDNSTNNTRLIVPGGAGGTFIVTGQVDFAPSGTGVRQAAIFKNGIGGDVRLAQNSQDGNGTLNRLQVTTGPIALSAADYVELVVFQNSGGALDAILGSGYTFLRLVRLG